MEESLRQLWVFAIWFAGISTTVTITLFTWLAKIQAKITLADSIKDNIERIVKDLDEIKVALKGDYEKKGLMTKHYDLEKRVEALESIR